MRERALLPAAVAAFDASAHAFDERFGEWRSVAAQRRAVRRSLLDAFPPDSHVLELAGGTAEDALYLARRGRYITMTDGAPAMIERARAKIAAAGLQDRVRVRQLVLEDVAGLAAARHMFAGAYSNFAGLNCVGDLRVVARGLAALLPPGAPALLVLFGPLPPGEVLLQIARGDIRTAFRRRRRGAVAARIGARNFTVYYHTPRAVCAAFAPWFELQRLRGIGVFVPPSVAEPAISRLPRLVRLLEMLDRVASAPLARLGDHVLFQFRRTAVPPDGAA